MKTPEQVSTLNRLEELDLNNDENESYGEELTLHDLLDYMKKRFDRLEEKTDLLTKASRSQAIYQEQVKARQHNSRFVNDLLPVPNDEGKCPNTPILSVSDFAKFEENGSSLNDLLRFYGFKEGKKKDFTEKGPLLQRKVLLASTLGVPLEALSSASVQYFIE